MTIAALETSYLLRSMGQSGEQAVTFSKWIVIKDIPLVAICYHKDFVDKSSHSKELYEAFLDWSSTLDANLKERTLSIAEFLAGEFAKKDVNEDYKCMISAIFAEIVDRKGMAGVYYLTVRADAKAYNVAISPDYVDRCLKLVAAGECILYKKGDHAIVDNETVCTIEDDTMSFSLSPIAPEYHIGRDKILEELAKITQNDSRDCACVPNVRTS
jgi:hypothetical protein